MADFNFPNADERTRDRFARMERSQSNRPLRRVLAAISVAVVGVVFVGAAGVFWATRGREAMTSRTGTADEPQVQAAAGIPRVRFTDVTRDAGITFVHVNGAYGDKLLPETMGGGCAFFDYDNDDDADLLLVNSCYWPGHQPADAPNPTLALYRNDGTGHFDDVTVETGLAITCYGMGVAVGDYDNDGWADLFISTVGSDLLLHNDGGKFVDVTAAAGVSGDPESWSTSCGWFDYDNDGDLDLFVANYLRWTAELDRELNCTLRSHARAYCRPDAFDGAFPYLYRNDGQGRFSEVSAEAGLHVRQGPMGAPLAKSLGVAPVDLDGDGWVDLVVANDTVRNLVFHNQAGGGFKELGVLVGVAFDAQGKTRGAMGIDCAHFRNDRALGIGIGNFANEPTALYVSQGPAGELPLFVDEAIATGLGPASLELLKFGLFFFDYDLDRRLDIFTANGHLEQDIRQVHDSQQYKQPPNLFWNRGGAGKAEFLLVPEANCGEQFARPMVGRGAAYADIDGDGDLDVLVTAIGDRPRLLRNDQALGHHWLRVKLRGAGPNRDAIGAWVEAKVAGELLSRQVMPTRSYMSQVELPVSFGFGDATKIDRLTVRWPDGTQQDVENVVVDQTLEVRQPR
jgi:enediyne biosynthesis protein E4